MKCIVALLMLLAGCSAVPKLLPQDPTLVRLDHAGDIAFNLEEPDQAATQYRAALARARAADDGAAIADAGFNLGTAELRAKHPEQALQTAAELRAELARRGMTDADFDLISATAQFRLNNLAAADQLAAVLTTETTAPLADAAWFLRGLIADRRSDQAGLQTAAAKLTVSADPADVAELRARLTHDRAQALHAAELRRDQLDYRGMARALALAAQFTPAAPQAADLYLRAGYSAAAQGETAEAYAWLDQARALASDSTLRNDAEQALHDLPKH